MSWHARLLLLSPATVERGLARLPDHLRPNLWQVELGVLRMWQRIVFRADTVGTCKAHPVRKTWRAKLLQWRLFRTPALFWERAITPWDLSGFLASEDQILRHLVAAHHDANQCVYDLQLLDAYPGGIDRLRTAVAAVVDGSNPRAEWLRDLAVFERYHDDLLGAIDAYVAGQNLDPEDSPDISFHAYLRWCRRQPATPEATRQAWTAGRFQLERGTLEVQP